MSSEKTELAEQLFARGALMGLHIGRWGAMKKMNADDLLLKEVDLGAMYLGHKKLLPKKAMEKLVELEGKARNNLAARSMDFPLAGARFVTYTTMPQIMEDLRALKVEWDAEVAKLVTEYPALREQQLAHLERQAHTFAAEEMKKHSQRNEQERQAWDAKQVELAAWLKNQKSSNTSFYPTVDELPSKFHFTWRMFRISALDGINELDPEEVQQAQERLRSDLREWVKSATASMHQTLGEAAANARQLLEKNGKLTPRNIKPLFDSFESFLMVDFTGKSSFRETIDTLKKGFLVKNPDGSYNLSATAEGLTNESSKDQFDELLTKLSELSVQDVAEKAGIRSLTGEFGRIIDL